MRHTDSMLCTSLHHTYSRRTPINSDSHTSLYRCTLEKKSPSDSHASLYRYTLEKKHRHEVWML